MKRRHFLSSSAMLAGVPLLASGVPSEFLTHALEEVLQEPQSGKVADEEAYFYWLYRNKPPTESQTSSFRKHGKASKTKIKINTVPGADVHTTMAEVDRSKRVNQSVELPAGSDESVPQAPIIGGREPKFVVYTAEKGFRFATELEDNELVEQGDVDVTVLVNALKPSLKDAETVAGAIGGSLRLDFGQQNKTPLPPLENALAWSSIGVLSATELGKKLPKMDSLKFDNTKGMLFGTPQTVPLVGGIGHWEWSFYVQKKESTWLRALKFIGGLGHIGGAATPGIFTGLGLPAIAWAALTSVDGLYAYLHAREVQSDWLFQGVQSDVAATQETKKLGRILLRKGRTQYLVVPNDHTSKLADRTDLKVSGNGFVVPKDLTNDLAAQDAASKTATDVTYISVTVDVQSRPKKVG